MMDIFDGCKRIFSERNTQYVAVGVGIIGIVYLCRKLKRPKARVCGVDYPKDTVIVHQFQKGRYAPSLGHFVVKLETYLRIAKIPYQPDYNQRKAPKNKWPWIEYNGVSMADSQMIINYLNKEFNVNLNKNLTPQHRAVAWAIQKWLEEFTYWLNVNTKWNIFFDETMDMTQMLTGVTRVVVAPLLRREVKKLCYKIGVGRHTSEEVHEMMKFDLNQLSAILGDKKFFMGDQPAEVDCTAFGQLSQIRWHTPDSCPGKRLLIEDLPNLMSYMDRIKALYWPDWNDRIECPAS